MSTQTTTSAATPLLPDQGANPAAKQENPYLSWLLIARQKPDVRGALRRADIDSTADRAYRHLARFWAGQSWLRTPILLHAAAAATHTACPHRTGQPLGAVAAELVRAKVLSANTVAARLLAVQRMDLPVAHRHLAGVLHAANANSMGVDWAALYDLYAGWDHRYLDTRRWRRRTLLEQFHSTIY